MRNPQIATPMPDHADDQATGRAPDRSGREAPIEMSPETFRALGHQVVDAVADFLGSLHGRPVTPAEAPGEVRAALGQVPLPEEGTAPATLLDETAHLLFDHSLFNGHPRFWGYITSSAAPIGALGDLLAAAVNPNVGAWALSPAASEIEAQTVRWLAELIGYAPGCGGLLVSGGNMANFVGFLAGRRAKASWDVRAGGLAAGEKPLRIYASRETHTWIEKAADLFGLGTDAICWIPPDAEQRMDVAALERHVRADRAAGYAPFLVAGAAGTVGTGAVDPLPAIAEVCRRYDLWFHVDGAYGAVAAVLPEASPDLKGLALADSVALDPHKWLYSPLEAGCVLVRDPSLLLDAFSFHPAYYNFGGDGEQQPVNYYELGLQNSRGFRALKVWLALRQVGRAGYVRMIRDDIALAEALYRAVEAHPELRAQTQHLSITTFRYVPDGLAPGDETVEVYLNDLNRELLNRLQGSGEAYVSNAVVDGRYLLRACIVNFRTALEDVEALPPLVARLGRAVDAEMRPAGLAR